MYNGWIFAARTHPRPPLSEDEELDDVPDPKLPVGWELWLPNCVAGCAYWLVSGITPG